MCKSLSLDLRERVLAFIEEGHSCREAARRFRISAASAVRIRQRSARWHRPSGRGPCGERPEADAPFGHWRRQTFIAGLRVDELIAPRLLDGPMNRAAFDA